MTDDDCCVTPNGSDRGVNDKMLYEFSAEVIKDRLKSEDPENIQMLSDLDAKAVIVISGSADKIESVFSAIKMPHNLVTPEEFMKIPLSKEQTVYVNCHTTAYPSGIHKKIRNFVAEGGQLITTDWSLNTILQECFPGFVRWDNASTGDQSVGIQRNENDKDDILEGFKNEKVWWLAGGSHPITIVDSHKVTALIKSEDLEKLFPNCGAILIRFEYEKGVVYHMISHFHLQHSATKPAKSSVPISSTTYYNEKGASVETMAKKQGYEKDYGRDFEYDEVQNATTQSEFCMRSVINQKKKCK